MNLISTYLPPGAKVVELGASSCDFALHLLHNRDDVSVAVAGIWSEREFHDIAHSLMKFGKRVEIVWESCSSPFTVFDREPLDLVFLNPRAYENVQTVLDLWWPRVRGGGFIGGTSLCRECDEIGLAVSWFLRQHDTSIETTSKIWLAQKSTQMGLPLT